MADRSDDFSLTLPILVFPIERKPRSALMIVSTFIFLSLLVATVTSLVLRFFQKHITESAAPIPESEAGGVAVIINLLYLLFAVILVTLLLILLIRYGKITFMKIMILGLMSYMIFTFTLYMGFLTSAYLLIAIAEALDLNLPFFIVDVLYYTMMIIAIVFIAIYIISAFKGRFILARNIILTLNVTWLGVWMSWNMGELTPIALLIGFALYDLYSVFRGPLKQLAETLKRNIVSSEGESKSGFGLGLGDIFFYSFAVGYSFAVLNPLETFAISIILLGGVLITIFLLFRSRAEALPALPIPVLSAVVLILIFKYLV